MVARHPKQVKCIVAGNYLVNFDADVGPVQVQKWTEKWGKRRDADPGAATHHCLIVKHVLATRAERTFDCDARRLLIQGVTLSENGLNATGPIATLTNVNHEEAVFGRRCQRKRMPLPFWSDVDFNLNVLANFVCVAPFLFVQSRTQFSNHSIYLIEYFFRNRSSSTFDGCMVNVSTCAGFAQWTHRSVNSAR